ncbi:MAG: phosphoglycerate dehydrogenase [Melioribacteraceae bacterium]|nr:phosphoglycerate dehydrogenase [Melioribacteraceae bacterium]
MSKKVLIADKFPEKWISVLEKNGIEVINKPALGENDLVEAAKNVDVVVVRSTKVNAEAINNSEDLKLIIRAGSGFNNIKTDAATAKGVAVANTPGKNAVAVAELAMGHILCLDRKIPSNVSDFNNGVWNKAEYSKADGLLGKTLGIIGVGNIGKELAKRALAFGINVIGYDLFEVKDVNFEMVSDLDELVKQSDIISLHLPANDKTKGMFNDEMFAKMKDGAMLINTSRAEVVNEDSLLKAVAEKGIVAGVDVFADEPEAKTGEVKSKLQGIKGIYVTHHIGASTEQAQDAVAEETINVILGFAKDGTVKNKVN